LLLYSVKMRQVTLEIQAECPVMRARAGVLHTAHGDVQFAFASAPSRQARKWIG